MNFRLSAILSMVFLFIASSVWAQPPINERMINAQCNEVVKNLNLDDKAKAADVSKLYKKYLDELNCNRKTYIKIFRINTDTITNEQVELYILKNIHTDKQAINIKEKYYKEFKTLLTSKQILIIYQTEAEITKRLTMEFCKRKENQMKHKKD